MSEKVHIDALDNWETYERELTFKRFRNCGNIDPSQYAKILQRDMIAPQPPKAMSNVARKESNTNNDIVCDKHSVTPEAHGKNHNTTIDLTANKDDINRKRPWDHITSPNSSRATKLRKIIGVLEDVTTSTRKKHDRFKLVKKILKICHVK